MSTYASFTSSASVLSPTRLMHKSSSSPATSSAVLSAVRGLRSKVDRLEQEKQDAQEDVASLRDELEHRARQLEQSQLVTAQR
jgi:outer membrane murein-binding lipoprotein Lpp